MNTIEQAREVSLRICIAGYIDESETIDALIADRNEWRDEALSAQERFKAAEDKLASIKGQQPVGHLDGLDECADFMSIALRKGHEVRNSSTPKMFTVPVYLAAGAQPVQQEPVMQHCPNCNHEQMALSVDCGNCGNVYDAAPVQAQERKPLTDDQITEVWRELREQKGDWSDLDFARAIEAYIKEQP